VSFVIASQIALWVAVLALGMVCMALARQIGVLHQRIAPAGALALRQPLKIGEPVPGDELDCARRSGGAYRRSARRAQPVAVVRVAGLRRLRVAAAGGALGARRGALVARHRARQRRRCRPAGEFVKDKGLGKFPYVLSEQLGRSFGVAKLPYAVLIDEAGKLAATGLVNTREHLESLFVAKERGVGSIQQFLGQRDPKRASAGE
jgi:hypothetical protein